VTCPWPARDLPVTCPRPARDLPTTCPLPVASQRSAGFLGKTWAALGFLPTQEERHHRPPTFPSRAHHGQAFLPSFQRSSPIPHAKLSWAHHGQAHPPSYAATTLLTLPPTSLSPQHDRSLPDHFSLSCLYVSSVWMIQWISRNTLLFPFMSQRPGPRRGLEPYIQPLHPMPEDHLCFVCVDPMNQTLRGVPNEDNEVYMAPFAYRPGTRSVVSLPKAKL
jgi:hypothetical protein